MATMARVRSAAVALSLVPTSGRSLDVRLSLIHSGAGSSATPPSRPTHFLSLRLPDPALHANVASVQAAIVANEKRARGCEVPPEKSHLTAFVLSLTDESVEQAKAALADCASLVAPASSPPRIRISGLGSFRQQVVFAQLQPSDDLDRVAALVRGAHQIFDARGLSPPAHDSWTPHLTLLKISRVGKPRKGKPTPKLPAAAYEDLPASSLDFGEHELGSLELCSMQGLGADGYYPVLASVSLDGRS